MANRRPKLPSQTETEVLIHSRRRCCLCFGLNFDTSYKRIQIAHLDGDRENNKIDNLAALCQHHHDEYDAVYKQTKGLTATEVKQYRQQLYSALDKEQQNLSLSFSKNQSNSKNSVKESATPSAYLLGRVLEAYDVEMDKRNKGGSVNGISLAYLASIAIDEFGDFDVAREILVSLVRLTSIPNKHWPTLSFSHTPSASPEYCAVSVLHKIQTKDFWEFTFTLSRLSDWVIQREEIKKTITIHDIECKVILPDRQFEAFTRVMYSCFRENAPRFADWAYSRILGHWKHITLGVALHMYAQDFQVPKNFLSEWLSEQVMGNLNSWFKEEDFRSDVIFVLSCHRLSRLQGEYFKQIIDMEYDVNFSEYRVTPSAPSVEENLTKIQQSALNASVISGIVEIRPDFATETEKKCRLLVNQVNSFGNAVIHEIREKIKLENEYIFSLDKDERLYYETF